jgi:hypothetical protein
MSFSPHRRFCSSVAGPPQSRSRASHGRHGRSGLGHAAVPPRVAPRPSHHSPLRPIPPDCYLGPCEPDRDRGRRLDGLVGLLLRPRQREQYIRGRRAASAAFLSYRRDDDLAGRTFPLRD